MPFDDPQQDDAPPTTSKRDAAEKASDQLADAKGDTIVANAVTINRPVGEIFAFHSTVLPAGAFTTQCERAGSSTSIRVTFSMKLGKFPKSRK